MPERTKRADARRKPHAKRSRDRATVVVVIAALVTLAAIAAWWALTGSGGRNTATPVADIGSATTCRQSPRFAQGLGLSPSAAIGTSFEGIMGLAIVDPTTGALTQDETWDDAGYLGPFTYDGAGNIYTAPVPLVSLLDNPPAEQNKVYRVDTSTAIMSEWIDLEPARPPSDANPFGVVALGYDCDTDSLYAASVMGSTPDEEVGRIFRIDTSTATVADTLEGIDAMGVGVFTDVTGKRLYYGHARSSALRSIALDENGDFVGEPRHELYVTDLEGGRDERVQRITFTPEHDMKLKGIKFQYTLRGAFDAAASVYTIRYDPETAAWSLVSLERH
jgi:hypothetical protein